MFQLDKLPLILHFSVRSSPHGHLQKDEMAEDKNLT